MPSPSALPAQGSSITPRSTSRPARDYSLRHAARRRRSHRRSARRSSGPSLATLFTAVDTGWKVEPGRGTVSSARASRAEPGIEPRRPVLRGTTHRHPVVQVPDLVGGRGGDHRGRGQPARRPAPSRTRTARPSRTAPPSAGRMKYGCLTGLPPPCAGTGTTRSSRRPAAGSAGTANALRNAGFSATVSTRALISRAAPDGVLRPGRHQPPAHLGEQPAAPALARSPFEHGRHRVGRRDVVVRGRQRPGHLVDLEDLRRGLRRLGEAA